MILPLTNDEASLVRYALNEMASKRAEQALDIRIQPGESTGEFALANEREARLYRGLANRITEQQKALNDALDAAHEPKET